jgi:hypothetical protein
MALKWPLALLLAMFVASCAQVPKESVELSATIGRDLAVVHKAHRDLAQLLFARMRGDVNRFVDDVYAPYQIRNAMDRQKELAISSNPDDRRRSLLLGINAAFTSDASPQLQAAVLKGMNVMVQSIRKDVESLRKEILDPLEAQEKEVLASVDRAYTQLHYANSIVTGHLSSVAKVHETQAELLQAIGVERDLRKDVGESLAKVSDRIGILVHAAETADDKLKEVEETTKGLKDAVRELGGTLRKSGQGG